MSARTFKLIGAAGAAALALGTTAGPAVAAGEETATVNYTCTSPAGDATPSATYAVNKPPAKMVAGQTVKLPATATFTLDAGTTGLAQVLGWTSFGGTLATTPTATRTGLNMTLAKTPLANGPAGTTVANVTGKAVLRAFKAGTYTLKLGNIGQVHLQGYDASNAPVSTVDFPSPDNVFKPCVNTAGATTLKDSLSNPATVAISKDGSKTVTKASYNSKKDVATGTATVAGSKYKLAGTGKVKFTLKKGTKTVKSITASLKKGKATAAFKKIKAKGSYSITASFKGYAGLKGSSGKATFKVK